MSPSRSLRSPLLVVALLLVAVSASACGSSKAATRNSSTASASAYRTYNQTDAAFASMMVPHHAGGVPLGKMAASKGVNPEIRRIGANIARSQSAQLKTLRQMAAAFRTMPMQSAAIQRRGDLDMQMLRAKQGMAFDTAWLSVISAHHMAAIMMAQMEMRGGINPQARRLASAIVKEQLTQLRAFNRLTAAGV